MKIKSYNLLFRFFSFLSDKTNGAPLFVRYKLLLGTLIIGLTGTSCVNKSQVTCYDPAPPDDDSLQITCYEPAAPIDTIGSPEEIDNMITCYDPIYPEESTINGTKQE